VLVRWIRVFLVAVILATLGVMQVNSYARAPQTATGVDYTEITRETSCSALRARYAVTYNVWRGAVKRGDTATDEALLATMRIILRRIYVLESSLKCGG